nr:MAG TPA: hypothetical protein [Caudoviricetes sp.]
MGSTATLRQKKSPSGQQRPLQHPHRSPQTPKK